MSDTAPQNQPPLKLPDWLTNWHALHEQNETVLKDASGSSSVQEDFNAASEKESDIKRTVLSLSPDGAMLSFPMDDDMQVRVGAKDIIQAAEWNDVDAMKRFLKKAKKKDLEKGDYANYTALQRAALRGHTEVAQLLVDAGAKVNVKNTLDETILMMAAVENKDLVELLVNAGAYINDQNLGGYSPLMFAVMNGKIDTVNFLIERDADVHDKNKDGSTMLMQACAGHPAIAQIFISKQGADLNEQSNAGYTALMWAAHFGSENCTRLLIGSGAMLDLKDNKGRTARDIAVEEKHPEIVSLIDAAVMSQKNAANKMQKRAAAKKPQLF